MEDPSISGVGRNADPIEGLIEGDARPDEEGDEVILPKRANIGGLIGKAALPVDMISWEVRSQISAGSRPERFGATHFGDLDQGAGLLIALTVEEKVVGMFLAKDHEIALNKSRGEPIGEGRVLAGTDPFSGRFGRLAGIMMSHRKRP